MSPVWKQSLAPLLRLAACTIVSIIAFWCPFIASRQFASHIADDRTGMVIIFCLPFLLTAVVYALVASCQLFRVIRHGSARENWLAGGIGALLALPTFLAVLSIAWSLIR